MPRFAYSLLAAIALTGCESATSVEVEVTPPDPKAEAPFIRAVASHGAFGYRVLHVTDPETKRTYAVLVRTIVNKPDAMVLLDSLPATKE